MSWKEWTAVGIVIGAGILLQIPADHEMVTDQEAMAGREMLADAATTMGTYRTVALDVTGMT
ncbi:MAG: hypothetical protein BMS9Abin29_1757 [Gemmatimonadota bacterium]|nr:MAG: hypothetical protein BMS9Abin29_1757 [Gemmatimonadota bacterium]